MARHAAMKEAFHLFDRDLDGKVAAREVPVLLRALGANPSEEELDVMLKGKEEQLLSFEQFEHIAGPVVNGVDPLDQLCKAFSNFDRDKSGTINANELRHVLLNLGEKLTADDVEGLLQLAKQDKQGNIKYRTFAQDLIGRSQ